MWQVFRNMHVFSLKVKFWNLYPFTSSFSQPVNNSIIKNIDYLSHEIEQLGFSFKPAVNLNQPYMERKLKIII